MQRAGLLTAARSFFFYVFCSVEMRSSIARESAVRDGGTC